MLCAANCHASHEVYHDGVAQRAHNLSPVPFGAAKRAKESSYHCSDTASQSQRRSKAKKSEKGLVALLAKAQRKANKESKRESGETSGVL